jgi:hypothetical protein
MQVQMLGKEETGRKQEYVSDVELLLAAGSLLLGFHKGGKGAGPSTDA